MQIFLDSANIKEIIEINDLGIIDGLTTNPSLLSKAIDVDMKSLIKQICSIVKGDVSVEVICDDYQSMIADGFDLLKIADNIVIKLPITWNGIKACKYFAQNAVKTNMTLCFNASQALLAAKVGAYYISPFIGRLDDACQNGLQLIQDIKCIYDNYEFNTKILAASIRNVQHVHDAALCGVDVATMPAKVLKQLIMHPLTTQGLDIFHKDWKTLLTK